ncbi:hypothetical protein [Streptomyces sp. NPDC057966]|uniref:hypothetical protein n=1 Tax=Streptomyces sp. NPDC057966 TaxID=3346292 RepID=UPI0036E498EA
MIAERGLELGSVQFADERISVAPAPGQVGGRTVMLIPHRTPYMEETMLPPDYQRILAYSRHRSASRRTGHGPAGRRLVGNGRQCASQLEPLRGKPVRLVDRGWLRKLPDSRFTTCL